MDGALIERARAGDAAALDQIAREAIDSVYRTAVGILGSPAEARDATHDALISARRSLRSLGEVGRFDTWLQRITVYAAKSVARNRRGVREIAVAPAEQSAGSGPPNAISATDFDRAFEQLTIDQRAQLLDYDLGGGSAAESGPQSARRAFDQRLRQLVTTNRLDDAELERHLARRTTATMTPNQREALLVAISANRGRGWRRTVRLAASGSRPLWRQS